VNQCRRARDGAIQPGSRLSMSYRQEKPMMTLRNVEDTKIFLDSMGLADPHSSQHCVREAHFF
jgi:hypothetical protein